MMLSFFFFFKQKTAYEMRISDWSSDVCSSDLPCCIWPEHVSVAKFRATEAAEVVMSHGNRNGHVDAKHPCLHLGHEAMRRMTAACEDDGAIAIFVRVGDLDGLIQVLQPHDAARRAEYFLLPELHLDRHMI